MPNFLRKLMKALGVGAAGLVILAAIGIGAFRLVVAELPSYQGQVQSWARDALGLNVSFSRLDARWGLRGPELTFYDASVARPDEETEPMISAAQVTLGLSPVTLFLERRLVLTRLVLGGTQLTLERSPEGELRLQGAPAGGRDARDLRIEDLPDVEVVLDGSTINYLDREVGLAWSFNDVRVRLERAESRVLLQARGTPPEALGGRIDISIDGALGPGTDAASGNWLVVAELRDFNLGTVATAFPDAPGLPRGGSGDLSIWLEIDGSVLRQATAQVAVTNLLLDSAEVAMPSYDSLAVTAEWILQDTGWRLMLTDLELSRLSRRWPEPVNVGLTVTTADDEVAGVDLQSNFVRLEDLSPLIAALPLNEATTAWQALEPSGDISKLSLRVARSGESFDYSAAADFERVGVLPHDNLPGINGLSGTLRSDSRSGRVVLATRDGVLDWPGMFRERIEIGELAGIMVWRQGRNGVRVVSDNLTFNNRDARTRSNLELVLPADGGAPRLDLETHVVGFDTTRTPGYLPVGKLPAPVVSWLDRAIVRGRVPEAEVFSFGPIDAFPFDGGEGQFRARFTVEDGALAYVDGWPVAEDISGVAEFVNAGFTARGSGRLMRNDRAEVSGGVADMRQAVLTVDGDVDLSLGELLDFMRTVPVTAQRLGPDLSRLQSTSGDGELSFDLSLPLKDIGAYDMDAELVMRGGELRVQGFDLTAGDIEGRLRLSNNVVTGEGIRASLLGSPVTANVAPADEAGYRARLDVSGRATADELQRQFDLPLGAGLSGETQWQGYLLLPSHDPAGTPMPLRLAVESDLAGISLDLPAPLAKTASEPMRLEASLTVLPMNRVDVEGRLGASRRFALSFWSTDSGPQFRRGSIRLDGGFPLLPPDDGLDIEGELRELVVDDWLKLLRAQSASSRTEPFLSRVDLDVIDMTVLGQSLGPTTFAVRQGRDQWLIELDSEPIAGHIAVPFDMRSRPQIVADMQRLHLSFADDGDGGEIDPRDLPGLLINSADFSVGERSFGRLSANVQTDPLGLRLVSYETVSDHFAIEGSGSWLAGGDGTMSRFAFNLLSEDVGATLRDLGLQPIVESEGLQVTASVNWPGGPSAHWQQAISGDLSLHMDQGSMINLEPGAGRMWGLLSFSALPRRLALDFRDVFNRGLVFDEVAGDFVLVDGNAYTDNLLLTGPVADIGVVGRTGLRNEDYQQQAVVTAEPGKVLPTMGFLASPGIGAALLLFTQIFKEPLKGIGRASYCVSGGWEAPVVERLTPEQLQSGYLCADLPPSAATLAESQQ